MLLNFNKIEKVMSEKEREEKYSSDCNVIGTFVPNMSVEDMRKWKGKHIKGKDERVEIRKSINGTQLVIIVYKEERYERGFNDYSNKEYELLIHKNVHISANGKIILSTLDYEEMIKVINESNFILNCKEICDLDLTCVKDHKALDLIVALLGTPKALKTAINSIEIDTDITVVKIPNINGCSFAIINKSNNVYSKFDKCFYIDISPSNRDDLFFEEFRYNTIEEAIITYFSNK